MRVSFCSHALNPGHASRHSAAVHGVLGRLRARTLERRRASRERRLPPSRLLGGHAQEAGLRGALGQRREAGDTLGCLRAVT